MLESIIATAIGSFIGFTICYFVWYRKLYITLKDTDNKVLKVDTYDGKLKVTTEKGATFEFPNSGLLNLLSKPCCSKRSLQCLLA